MGGRVPRSALALLAVIGGLFCALLPAGPAAAHNSLTSSEPADGARLTQPPGQVRLTFLARPDPGATKITITGPDNHAAAGGQPVFAGSRVTVPFKPGAAGLYIVAYQLPADDGHLGKGEIRFTLAVGSTPTAATSPPASPALPVITPSPAASVGLTPAAGTGETGGGPPWWVWVLLGVLLLVASAAAALMVRRRRRRAGPADQRT